MILSQTYNATRQIDKVLKNINRSRLNLKSNVNTKTASFLSFTVPEKAQFIMTRGQPNSQRQDSKSVSTLLLDKLQ